MKRRQFFGLLPSVAAITRALAADERTAVVLLHGKQGRPNDLYDIAGPLRSAGYAVAVPEMPWSQRREYDVPYPQALDEIAAAAQKLAQEGTTRLIVAGHSLGANGALAYAASGKPVAGVVALSPGHVPEVATFRGQVAPGVQKAREMIARGAGEEKATFPDNNQGRQRQVRTTAAAYLSYFDPEGMGSLARSTHSLPAGVPLFMSVGETERILAYARDTLFPSAPHNEKSVFLTVPGDHFGAPRAATPRLVEWVRSVTG
jgi:pimeloyl-ACP methyl ester carboxylesterase